MTSPGSLEALVRRGAPAPFTDEYGCKLRRLLPWPGQAETKRPVTEFGVIWVVIEPGKAVDAHLHDEEETFIVLSGSAELVLGQERTSLAAGDTVYIPRFAQHSLRNESDTAPFVMIDIYWDWQGREAPPAEGIAA